MQFVELATPAPFTMLFSSRAETISFRRFNANQSGCIKAGTRHARMITGTRALRASIVSRISREASGSLASGAGGTGRAGIYRIFPEVFFGARRIEIPDQDQPRIRGSVVRSVESLRVIESNGLNVLGCPHGHC